MNRILLLYCCVLLSIAGNAQYQMEWLNRGLYAVPDGKGNAFVSWRLWGTEKQEQAFNLYRAANGKTIRLNQQPITDVTGWTDKLPDNTADYTYIIKAIFQGKEESRGESFLLRGNNPGYLSVPLRTPPGYTANDASVGDLDGDGSYEIVLHFTSRARDNSHRGQTDPPIFHAYKLDGSFLWEINLGKNIREGAHYTQFMVYDLDGDGRAEVTMKTADGTVDGMGVVIGDSSKDYRNENGFILQGPEYLTVFDGLTGAALSTVKYDPPRHPDADNPTVEQMQALWGDGRGNRMDRFLACVAYLDGKSPSLVMCRGYYTRTVLAAWDFKDKKLVKRWVFDSDKPGNKAFAGQGNHNLSVTDVDADGKDEIIYGQMTIDDDGSGLYSTGIGHGDALHVGDLDPQRPGLEVFGIQERFGDAGANFRDARTGEVIWKIASIKAGDDGEGPGRGLALDIDPRYPGSECWVTGAGITGLYSAKGEKIADSMPPCNMGIFWDGDALSEILNGVRIDKWDYQNQRTQKILDGADFGAVSNNGTKANPCLSADIFGDWREELITRTADSKELRIFSTSIPTTIKLYTLMHNPQYRLSIAWQNVAYNQPPHVSYFLGHGMKTPPAPAIKLVKPKK